MSEHPRPRRGLFLLACALLITVAILLAQAPGPSGNPSPQDGSSGFGSRRANALLDSLGREEARLGAVGRRFVSAFLRFEVGDLSPEVRASLGATASAGFVRELEAAPPRLAGRGRPAGAQIEQLEISLLTDTARRALLSGVARRPDGPEEFSFLFALRNGRWRALGVGE